MFFVNPMLDWGRVFSACETIRDTRVREFQFKFLHRIISTNAFLYKIKVLDDSTCTFCHEAEETIEHLFWSRNEIVTIWKSLEEEFFRSKIKIEYENVCFGFSDPEAVSWHDFVVFYAKYHIYYSRLQKISPHYGNIKQKVIFNLNVEKHLLEKNKKYVASQELDVFLHSLC